MTMTMTLIRRAWRAVRRPSISRRNDRLYSRRPSANARDSMICGSSSGSASSNLAFALATCDSRKTLWRSV